MEMVKEIKRNKKKIYIKNTFQNPPINILNFEKLGNFIKIYKKQDTIETIIEKEILEYYKI